MKTFLSALGLCLIGFSSRSISAAQENEALKFFPYKTGDLWEYWVTDGVTVDTAQIINIKDSVSADGKIRLRQYRRFINPIVHDPYLDSFSYTIDTSTAEILQPFGEPTDPPRITNVPVYKFNAQQGDQWVMYDYSRVEGVGYEMARVEEQYDGELFGISTRFIVMGYFFALDSTDTLGLSREVRTLAKGFGLVEYFPAEGGYWYRVKGAVINGILYGDTTMVVTSISDNRGDGWPASFELHQNYPNPFNSITTISLSLRESANLSLIIYDVMGRQVKALIDNEWFSWGTHRTQWDGMTASGKPASTGVYYYKIVINGSNSTHSMLLIK